MKRGMCVLIVAALAGCDEQPAGPRDEEPAVVRRAECRRVVGKIRIDGKLDELARKQAVVLVDFAALFSSASEALMMS